MLLHPRYRLAFGNTLILAGLIALQTQAMANDDGRIKPPSVQQGYTSR